MVADSKPLWFKIQYNHKSAFFKFLSSYKLQKKKKKKKKKKKNGEKNVVK